MWADYGTILNVVQSLKVMGIVFLIVLTIGTLGYFFQAPDRPREFSIRGLITPPSI
jgi:hypothetical protein